MRWDRFSQIMELFTVHGIRSIIGVIPENRDPEMLRLPEHPNFWSDIRKHSDEGHIIAQHGYQHRYETSNGGMLNINEKSEFAGLPYDTQLRKIRHGNQILEKHIAKKVTWWMAPAHSFDQNTCRALVASGFTHITDGIALFPFKKHGLTWIPQQLWKARPMPFGVWTICIHPNTLRDEEFELIRQFVETRNDECRTDPRTLEARTSILNPIFRIAWRYALMRSRSHQKRERTSKTIDPPRTDSTQSL